VTITITITMASIPLDVDPPVAGLAHRLSEQRVTVVMNPDGSISKPSADSLAPTASRPRLPIRPSEAELHHPTVAAPVSEGVPHRSGTVAGEGDSAAAVAVPPQLANTPVDTAAIVQSTVTKKPLDDARPIDVEELTRQGHDLDERGPLVNGVSREDVWALVRRFDKVCDHRRRRIWILLAHTPFFFFQQVQHVRETEVLKTRQLDLRTAQDDQFAPEKLRANLERLYLTVVR
jgi:hypothetical protein